MLLQLVHVRLSKTLSAERRKDGDGNVHFLNQKYM